MRKVATGALLGVAATLIGLFIASMPYSLFFLMTTINELRGVPMRGTVLTA